MRKNVANKEIIKNLESGISIIYSGTIKINRMKMKNLNY